MSRTCTLWLLALAATAGCSPIYVVRGGIEEAKILSRRRPIAEVRRDPSTDAETRRKLDLVVQARDFAERWLDLAAGESFTTFSYVDSDTLLMVVSAAEMDRFRAYTWWFPIVGRVPYKGFFDFDAAYTLAAQLEARGFDTYVRPSGAFSTLGWFNDPLLNTVLRYDDVALAATVIHEITHNTLFVPSQVAFNESYASFVGDRGAALFFCERDGPDSDRCGEAEDAWQDNLVYGAFLSDLVQRLESLYAREDLTRNEKIAQREGVFDGARTRFTEEVEPRLRTRAFRGFPRARLNNATLIGVRLYYDRLHLFEAVYQHQGRDLIASIRAIEVAARARPEDPFAALVGLLGQR